MRPSLPSFTARHSMPPPPRQRPAPIRSLATSHLISRHGKRISISSALLRMTVESEPIDSGPVAPSWPVTAPAEPS